MKNKAACIIIILFILVISVCIFVGMSAGQNADFLSISTNGDINSQHNNLVEDIPNTNQIVKATEYYCIVQSESLYYCYFYDQNHNVVKIEGPFSKIPHVLNIDDVIVKFTLQAGTGIGTQWGYFYDTRTGSFSDIFQSIFDQYNGKVAYANGSTVFVRDIFDETVYYKEISEFSSPLSEVVEPFCEIRFVENGSYIEITYLSGADYKKITERFKL